MIALRVQLNDRTMCLAGAEDLAVLNAIVGATGNLGPKTKRYRDEPPDLRLRVGGLTGRTEGDDEHLTWVSESDLEVGDIVQVELLDVESLDEPDEASPYDKERHDKRRREKWEYAKEVYHAFRNEFEERDD